MTPNERAGLDELRDALDVWTGAVEDLANDEAWRTPEEVAAMTGELLELPVVAIFLVAGVVTPPDRSQTA